MTYIDLIGVTSSAGCALACLFGADGHVFIAPILGRNPTGDYRRANRLSCRFVPQPDKSAWSRFGRPKGARRVRPKDGAHQLRLCFRSQAPVSAKNPARSSHPLVQYPG